MCQFLKSYFVPTAKNITKWLIALFLIASAFVLQFTEINHTWAVLNPVTAITDNVIAAAPQVEVVAKTTVEDTDGPSATRKTLYVGAEEVDCEGVAPQKCLLVKENPEDEYTLFYDTIEGFEWEAGFEYQLLVDVEEVPDPPADASSMRYTLVEVVAKTAVEDTDATRKTLYVGAEEVDCEGVAPQKCLRVKENPEDEYTLFYNTIEGFEWEAGFEYQLLVDVEEVPDPPPDAFPLRYTLVEVVAKTAAEVTDTTDIDPSSEPEMKVFLPLINT